MAPAAAGEEFFIWYPPLALELGRDLGQRGVLRGPEEDGRR